MILIKNRKANHDYTVLKKFEAGMALKGCEAKSIRVNKCKITESYIICHQGELFIQKLNIQNYKFANQSHGESNRPIKLLLKRKEIDKITNQTKQERLALIPLCIYEKNSYLKVEISIAKGKKQYDKRREEREKSLKKEKLETIKQYHSI